jgi:hypothetical protein
LFISSKNLLCNSNSDILGVRERITGGVGGVTGATSLWRQTSGRRDAHLVLRRPPSGSQVSSGLQLLLAVSSGLSQQAGEDRCQAGGTRIQRCAGYRQEVRSVQDYLCKLVKIDVRKGGTHIQRCAGYRKEVRSVQDCNCFYWSVQDHPCKLVKTDIRQEGRASSDAQATVRKSGQFRTTTTFSGQSGPSLQAAVKIDVRQEGRAPSYHHKVILFELPSTF